METFYFSNVFFVFVETLLLDTKKIKNKTRRIGKRKGKERCPSIGDTCNGVPSLPPYQIPDPFCRLVILFHRILKRNKLNVFRFRSFSSLK